MSFFSPQLSLKQMSILCHQLTTTNKAGIPVKRSFALLQESASSLGLRRVAGNIAGCLEEGATLAQAIHWEGKCFPEFFIAMVQVGERTGTLERVFSQLEEYYDALWKIKLSISKVLIYILSVLLCAFIGIPLLKYFLMGVATQGEWGSVWDIFWIVLNGATPFIFWAVLYAVTMRIPPLKRLARLLAWYLWPFRMWTRPMTFSRFYEALYLFQYTDIGFAQSLPAAGKSTGNLRLMRALAPVVKAIQEGQSFAESLRLVKSVPGADIHILLVGEVSGSLAKTFQKLSRDHYETALFRLRNFVIVLSALLIIPVAFLVL